MGFHNPNNWYQSQVKRIVEEVNINNSNAVSNFRISDPLREKFKEKGIEVLFRFQAMTFDMVLDDADIAGRVRTGYLKQESLQKELKRASLKLTSQAREIKELKHKLWERYEKLPDMQSYFHFREGETDRTRVEFSIKTKKVFMVVSEFENKPQLLSQANEIIKRQAYDINTLQRALIKEKEEEIEFYIVAESINCQKDTFSMYLRGELDNIQEEMDALRDLHRWKLDDNGVENLLNKMKRREVNAQSTSRSESTQLQIFVRMIYGGKTIVIYTNKNNTVEQLHHRIEPKVKVPVKEQLVIYKGERRDIMYAVSRMLRGDWICPRNKLYVSYRNILGSLLDLFLGIETQKRELSVHGCTRNSINDLVSIVRDLKYARSFETDTDVKKRDKIIEKLYAEIEVLKMAKSHPHGSADQLCNKAIELQEQLEEANMMKRSGSDSLVSLTKQLEGRSKRLHAVVSEMTELKDKAKLMAMAGLRQSEDLYKSEQLLETAEELLSKDEKEAIKMKSELETVKEEKKQGLKKNQILMEEKNKIRSKVEEEKSEISMQILASALHQASSESRVLKEELLSLGGQDYEMQVEHYKNRIEVTQVSEVKQIKMRETGLFNHVKKFDEEVCKMRRETNRLGNLVKRAHEETDGALKKESLLRDDLKEVEDDVICLQEALREARAESLKLNSKMLDKETEFKSILHDNDLLRVKENDDKSKRATGHIFYVGESLIRWCSSKQENVVVSSCETENMAGIEAMKHAILFQELHRLIPESENRVDVLMKEFGKLKLKKMRGIIKSLFRMDFKLKGEIVGVSLKLA
ncbi:hypothetical protein Rs2_31056 [Raphanus sativus]|nr:hypothetical protein Rs2_31056 [Raphanus sativus]